MFYTIKHVAAHAAKETIQLSFSGKRLLRRVVSLLLVITLLFSGTFVSRAESASYALDDPELLPKLEEQLASNLQKQLGRNAKVESVQAVYVSKEYLEELEYNSQANIFFGHTLEELNEMFEGTRYVFALGEDGSTIVKEADEAGLTAAELIGAVIGVGLVLVTAFVVVYVGSKAFPVIAQYYASVKNLVDVGALSALLGKGITELVEEMEPSLQEQLGEVPQIIRKQIGKRILELVMKWLRERLGFDKNSFYGVALDTFGDLALGGIGGVVEDWSVMPDTAETGL